MDSVARSALAELNKNRALKCDVAGWRRCTVLLVEWLGEAHPEGLKELIRGLRGVEPGTWDLLRAVALEVRRKRAKRGS